MWIIKRDDSAYFTGMPVVSGAEGWAWRQNTAERFSFRAEAEGIRRILKGNARIVRLVPKRRGATPCLYRHEDLVETGARMEREFIAAWFERTFTQGILGTDTARRIRAGEHRK
jgi:hypothetical protein